MIALQSHVENGVRQECDSAVEAPRFIAFFRATDCYRWFYGLSPRIPFVIIRTAEIWFGIVHNSWDAVTQPEAGIEHHTTRIIRYEFENAVRGKDYFFILRLDCGPRLIFRAINCRKVVCASVVAKHASELAPWFNKFVQFKQ